eukprot:TRINITY_DN1344_c0_g1_i1.p1 TRINITY_DN1344_c0_g1~~TRINITY_DN1344_c0_g1_i1.p1  ORF type:complete len:109 (-),score=22.44 TRINITY_DN1344_c0_g1_i1:133-459(-)
MAEEKGKHTIVLAQFTSKPNSRQYSDFESVQHAMDGVCQMFEHKLKQQNPNRRKITYDISDLYEFIDKLPDLCCLVFSPELTAYVPRDKKWIKKQVFAHLRKQAGTAS